jgi:hypothetical protein
MSGKELDELAENESVNWLCQLGIDSWDNRRTLKEAFLRALRRAVERSEK